MTTRYSKITGTFYPLDIDYGASLPVDVAEVAKADFDAAMARPAGTTFGFVGGALVITAAVPPAFATIKAGKFAELTAARAPVLAALAGIAGRASRSGDAATAADADAAAVALLGLKYGAAVIAATSEAELKTALVASYTAIVLQTGIEVRTAFAGFSL